MLKYYNINEEITLECDASQYGLGAAMKQNGQPVAYASRALTQTESQYAQIEKELLAIVFACERFTDYIYGRASVNIETDHKPLEIIFRKPLSQAPKRLQRMLLRLQKFDLQVKYLKGPQLLIADTLSRAFIHEINMCMDSMELDRLDLRSGLLISDERWQQFETEARNDPIQQQLRDVIQQGWPESKAGVPDSLAPYFTIRDELTAQGNIIFKGQQVLVPASMRKELLKVTHASHIGIEGCLRRARDCLYWPGMSAELKDYVSRCEVCMMHRRRQTKEPLMQHDFAARPWSKVGADIANMGDRNLLIVVDYYSNYIEVARLTSITSRSMIRELQIIFSRFGIPDTLVTDNGPQFSSAEFVAFAKSWGFQHITSSPVYPQSNGKAENAVKTVKQLFLKCRQAGQPEQLALLDWRNTPTEGLKTSPAQRLFGRRCRTLLPIRESLLKQSTYPDQDCHDLLANKARQEYYYNRTAKPLPPLETGDSVRIRLPGKTTLSAGTCVGQCPEPRSYDVEVDGAKYRRNRRDILLTKEQVPEQEWLDEFESANTPVDDKAEEDKIEEEFEAGPRRSGRLKRTPVWMKDYVPK